jgi:hypothetical protein
LWKIRIEEFPNVGSHAIALLVLVACPESHP